MRKTWTALLLALCLTVSLSVPALAAGAGFERVNVYTPG